MSNYYCQFPADNAVTMAVTAGLRLDKTTTEALAMIIVVAILTIPSVPF